MFVLSSVIFIVHFHKVNKVAIYTLKCLVDKMVSICQAEFFTTENILFSLISFFFFHYLIVYIL